MTTTTTTTTTASREKANGIHYTPSPLAAFVAERAVAMLGEKAEGPLRVLDPACGDGELLLAAGRELRDRGVDFELVGFDADSEAVTVALARLEAEFGTSVRTSVTCSDFIALVMEQKASEAELWSSADEQPPLLSSFDLVIANPPYVRTQVLGAKRAQELAAAFGLSGRVDLYQAFVLAIHDVVRVGGQVGLIVSNRFLMVKGGATLRSMLARNFAIDRIVDLGDTKLFHAAVLPALVFAHRCQFGSDSVSLTSVYEERSGAPAAKTALGLLELLRDDWSGLAEVEGRTFSVRQGQFPDARSGGRPWVAAADDEEWLRRVDKTTFMRLGDIGKIRVGIKTTADSVFIRENWSDVEPQPEADLLMPLITHQCAARWRAAQPARQVLYPYDMAQTRRIPLQIEHWPAALAYLEQHRERLAGRKYVVEAGRLWWEIWVPQRPGAWKMPRLVFPDISERPRFFLDESGAVVNGDCYWLSFPEEKRDIALLGLAVANSSLAERYYDARCGNKLYAGRRRFITQYVEDFPIPDPGSDAGREIIRLTAPLVAGSVEVSDVERDLDVLVWQAFELEDMCG